MHGICMNHNVSSTNYFPTKLSIAFSTMKLYNVLQKLLVTGSLLCLNRFLQITTTRKFYRSCVSSVELACLEKQLKTKVLKYP